MVDDPAGAYAKALQKILTGVNHIATWRTPRWPEAGTEHQKALEVLGAGQEYDMWCCWNTAMLVRAELVEHGYAQ
jgi:hypothetical protein